MTNSTARSLTRDSIRAVAVDDDHELLARWVAGDRRAGDALVKRHYKSVTSFFINAVGDQERDNLTQKTFEALCTAAPQFANRSSFRAFLFGIARNVLNGFLRERYKGRDRYDPEQHTLEDVDQRSVSRVISDLGQHSALVLCLRELPVATKEMLELFYWHDMTSKELGDVLGIPQTTVRVRLFNARAALRRRLAEKRAEANNVDVDTQFNDVRRLLGLGPLQGDRSSG